MKYPNTMYIQHLQDDGESFYLVHEESKYAKDGEVAVYELVKVMKKVTETHLEDK